MAHGTSEIHRRALELAREIRESFVESVVNGPVVDRRIGDLPEKHEEEIRKGRRCDVRPVRLMSMSGKGGPGHEGHMNVSLLDHTLTVAFGACLMSLIDNLADGVDEDIAVDLAHVVTVVGFSHDLDKDIGKEWRDINVADVEDYADGYGLLAWLTSADVHLSGLQLWALIKAVEVRTAQDGMSTQVPDAYRSACRRYVRLADKLDSVFLSGTPDETAEKVSQEWNRIRHEAFSCEDVIHRFQPVVVSDPHHPFLLDVLHGEIAEATERLSGTPPLIHVIQDSTLISFLPTADMAEIIAEATNAVAESLPFDSSMVISPQGGIKLSGATPTWKGAIRLVEAALERSVGRRLFSVKNRDLKANKAEFEEVASAASIPVHLDGEDKALPAILAAVDRSSREWTDVCVAALVSFALGLAPMSRDRRFKEEARLKALLDELGIDMPEWVMSMERISQRTAISLFVTAAVRADEDLHERLLGRDGLIASWFGPEGMSADRADRSPAIREAVRTRLQRLLDGQLIEADERLGGRCLITGEPVDAGRKIAGEDELYGIKASAISYRPGRSEEKFSAAADTHISAASYAEYRLRNAMFSRKPGKAGGIPVRLSSTVSSGFFGLATPSERMAPLDLSLYDLMRADRKDGKAVFFATDSYNARHRIGRFDELPNRFADRIAFFRMAITSALRSGRPIHVFQGLPYLRPEFFYADCLGPELRSLIGGDGLRLEALPGAVDKLEVIEFIAKKASEGGLGDVSLAKAICLPETRLDAACLAWDIARTRGIASSEIPQLDNIAKEMVVMENEGEAGSTVRLARLARAIQRGPRHGDSRNDETFLIRTAVEAASNAYVERVSDRDEIVAYVAGAVREHGDRRAASSRGFYSSKEWRREGQDINDAIETFSSAFVDGIWIGRFNARPPSHARLRGMMASFVWAFARGVRSGTDKRDAAA